MRLVRRLLFVVAALIVVGVGTLLVSSRLSLDTEYGHTRRVEMLQPLSPGTSRGLVQIRARDLSFRARGSSPLYRSRSRTRAPSASRTRAKVHRSTSGSSGRPESPRPCLPQVTSHSCGIRSTPRCQTTRSTSMSRSSRSRARCAQPSTGTGPCRPGSSRALISRPRSCSPFSTSSAHEISRSSRGRRSGICSPSSSPAVRADRAERQPLADPGAARGRGEGGHAPPAPRRPR